MPGGYAWIFPKADHVNVGVAGWEGEASHLRRHLGRLLAEHGLPAEAVVGLRGHRLPLRAPHAPLAGSRVLLVGDAAGLVDPLSGDGIYEAALSANEAGAIAGRFLDGSVASLDEYTTALLARTGSLTAASWEWKHAYDRFPRLSFEITRLPFAWPVIQELLRGDLVDPASSRGLHAVPILLLGLLGRMAKAPAGRIDARRHELSASGASQPRRIATARSITYSAARPPSSTPASATATSPTPSPLQRTNSSTDAGSCCRTEAAAGPI